LRRGAVEHDVGRDSRRRIGGAAGEQETVAGLTVQDRDRVGERRLRRDLARGLFVVVEHERRRGGCLLDLGTDVAQSLQRQIGHVEAGVDVVGGIGKGVEARDLGAQIQREATVGALPGIGGRNLSGRQLRRQIVELIAYVDDGGPDIGRLAANAVDRHRTLTWPGAACRTSA
jgi:hypothetical protein